MQNGNDKKINLLLSQYSVRLAIIFVTEFMISFTISLFYISVHTAKCDSYEDCEFMVMDF